MRKELLLTLLGYLGLFIAAVSSIWGTLRDTSTRDAEGRKRLTKAGYLAIALVSTGLIMNVTSKLLGARIDAEKTAQRIAQERLRSLRLASSSQPLLSLGLEWTFSGLPADTLATLATLEAEVKDTLDLDDDHKVLSRPDRKEWAEALKTARVAYPWWAYLATGRFEIEPDVLIRVPLNQSEAVVLPLGALKLSRSTGQEPEFASEQDQWLGVSASVAAYEDANYDPAGDRPSTQRSRAPGILTTVSVEGDRLVMRATIEPQVLALALDKTAPGVPVLTLLPEQMQVLVLSSLTSTPPWPINNLSGRLHGRELRPAASAVPPYIGCSLRLLPNDVPDLAAEYSCLTFGRGTVHWPKSDLGLDDSSLSSYALIKLQRRESM